MGVTLFSSGTKQKDTCCACGKDTGDPDQHRQPAFLEHGQGDGDTHQQKNQGIGNKGDEFPEQPDEVGGCIRPCACVRRPRMMPVTSTDITPETCRTASASMNAR